MHQNGSFIWVEQSFLLGIWAAGLELTVLKIWKQHLQTGLCSSRASGKTFFPVNVSNLRQLIGAGSKPFSLHSKGVREPLESSKAVCKETLNTQIIQALSWLCFSKVLRYIMGPWNRCLWNEKWRIEGTSTILQSLWNNHISELWLHSHCCHAVTFKISTIWPLVPDGVLKPRDTDSRETPSRGKPRLKYTSFAVG